VRGELLVGLGIGIGLGVTIGYLIVKWRQAESRAPPTPTPTGALTTITRDEHGRITDILEKNIYGPVVG